MEMKLLKTLPEIDKGIASWARRGQALETFGHMLACSVLSHVIQHGDIRVVAKFINASPNFVRSNALRKWFEEYGPVAFDGNNPVFNRAKVPDLEAAMKKPFWRFSVAEGKPY